jgi:hypothetical protein
MLQFYFLSIVANALGGLSLAGDYLADKFHSLTGIRDYLNKTNVRTTVGIFAFVVGVLKLLIRSTPTDVPVVGDLLPALAGIAMGGALFLGAVRERGSGGETAKGLEKAVVAYRVPLGLAGLVIAVLHFLLPGALLL